MSDWNEADHPRKSAGVAGGHGGEFDDKTSVGDDADLDAGRGRAWTGIEWRRDEIVAHDGRGFAVVLNKGYSGLEYTDYKHLIVGLKMRKGHVGLTLESGERPTEAADWPDPRTVDWDAADAAMARLAELGEEYGRRLRERRIPILRVDTRARRADDGLHVTMHPVVDLNAKPPLFGRRAWKRRRSRAWWGESEEASIPWPAGDPMAGAERMDEDGMLEWYRSVENGLG